MQGRYAKIILCGILIVIGLISIPWMGHDNPLEQEVEKIIKDETKLDIDLSQED